MVNVLNIVIKITLLLAALSVEIQARPLKVNSHTPEEAAEFEGLKENLMCSYALFYSDPTLEMLKSMEVHQLKAKASAYDLGLNNVYFKSLNKSLQDQAYELIIRASNKLGVSMYQSAEYAYNAIKCSKRL